MGGADYPTVPDLPDINTMTFEGAELARALDLTAPLVAKGVPTLRIGTRPFRGPT